MAPLQNKMIYIYVISKLSTEHQLSDLKPNKPGISLFLPENNLENALNFKSAEMQGACTQNRIEALGSCVKDPYVKDPAVVGHMTYYYQYNVIYPFIIPLVTCNFLDNFTYLL